ncbi:MAG: hypothetical protein AB7H93_10530 [Vicinamibacterales bacterium]
MTAPIRMHVGTDDSFGMNPGAFVGWIRRALGQSPGSAQVPLLIQPDYAEPRLVAYDEVFPTTILLIDSDTYTGFGAPKVRPDFTVVVRAEAVP